MRNFHPFYLNVDDSEGADGREARDEGKDER